MKSAFELIAILLALSALFGYVNHRFVKLPHTIGLLVIALAVSLAIIGIEAAFPFLDLKETAQALLGRVDFTRTLMESVLSFLLFAGALHVDVSQLFDRKWVIGLMATFGVCLTTALVGGGMYLIFGALGIEVPFLVCLVFGALIAPTDPVAVLSTLKTVRVPPSLEAKIAGESLFNDGVGVVVFTILVAIAFGAPGQEISAGSVGLLFVKEAFGGALLGLATGWLTFLLMRSIDEYTVEILLSLALVTGTYVIALRLHVSGPIAVVMAGLLIGNRGTRLAMSETTREHLLTFWELIDEILNSLLFLLIGFEVLAVSGQSGFVIAALLAIPLVLACRLISVSLPILALGVRKTFTKGAIWVLTWGGLRGGISVALALSLPPGPMREVLLTACYGVVIFSVVIQGVTVGPLIKRVVPAEPPKTG
ncbi:MAG: sodium:proton antiporter [Alphaproteobacteria bacterium]|nr:sodium:proton antiporter [Alphaproteobacteria bacterium]